MIKLDTICLSRTLSHDFWLYSAFSRFTNRLIQVSEPNQLRIGETFYLINHTFILERVGVMLNGKVSFCTKFSKIIKVTPVAIVLSLLGSHYFVLFTVDRTHGFVILFLWKHFPYLDDPMLCISFKFVESWFCWKRGKE